MFLAFAILIPIGGFRAWIINWAMIIALLMVLERLRGLLLMGALGAMLALGIMATFASSLPLNYQRAFSFLPFNWSLEAKMNAEASKEWRYAMWHDLWPKVPQYLLLGKGYLLTQEDFQMMGSGSQTFGYAARLDASMDSLAISGDYHNGPLSTVIPFGIWGGIGMVWLMGACLWVHYRNYRYGPPELLAVNTFLLIRCIVHVITFFFIFGGFSEDVGYFVRYAGFCIALNGGVMSPQPKAAVNPRIKPLPSPSPAPAPQAA